MKTSSMTFFCSLLFLSVMSAGKLPQKFSEDVLIVREQTSALANKTPACLDRSAIPKEELHWLYMPSSPKELATNEYYGFLSGQLIQTGAVNASDCPLNGLWATGYANACGLEKTREASLYLQNVYDDEILAVGNGIGVPPVMMKQLIRYESQFWPMPWGPYHTGLGHLTWIGASNALLWSPQLLLETKANAPDQLSSLPDTLLSMMNASCPTCTYKMDVPKAEKSVHYLGEALLGYCRQTSQVVQNATDKNAADVVDYATIWKLTLLNYNTGPLCVYDAINASYGSVDKKADTKLSWNVIAKNIDNKYCQRGIRYVENITAPYYDFATKP